MKYLCFFIFSSLILCCSCNNHKDSEVLTANVSTSSTLLKKKNNSKVNWMTFQEAEKARQKEPKSIFVMVYANWCSNSKKFDETTYQNPEIIEMLNNNFYAVKLNAHEPNDIDFKGKTYANPNYNAVRGLDQVNAYHEILFKLEAKSVPSTVFLNKDGIVVGSEMGYKNPTVFNSLLGEYQHR